MESPVLINTAARSWTFTPATAPSEAASAFHQTLPAYGPTPLRPLPSVAAELGLAHVLLKDEGDRFGLPSFKILGASWAVYRAVLVALGIGATADAGLEAEGEKTRPQSVNSLADLGARARERGLTLLTTTEGNWGRAVARMARYMGVPALVYVPGYMPEATRARIRGEGAEVRVVEGGSYDDCVAVVRAEAAAAEGGAMLMVMDVGFEGYEEIPQWVLEGYSTMLKESDVQVPEATGGKAATHAFVPVGVGSIAQAVTQHHKRAGQSQPGGQLPRVLAVEPDTAAGLKASLAAGCITAVATGDSIMCGMNCGTVSTTAWPALRAGVDACVTVTDREAHEAVCELKASYDVRAGPCGAATLAALRRVCADTEARDKLGLDGEAVVVLYCTEGAREYDVPQ